MNYEELLRKYMSLIIDCEGVSFIDHRPYGDIVFTKEEVMALEGIEKKIRGE